MKKIFESDSFLKIFSVVIAVILWLYIIVVLDPAIEVEVREIPIQYVGMEEMERNGISVVSESATTINLKVKGSRKKMGRYDMKTIIAKADLSEVSEVGKHKLPVEIVIPFENSGIASRSLYHVEIQTEQTVKKELALRILTEGSLAENYMPGEMSVNPKSVVIRGPESVIGKIEEAGVVLNYGAADVDITQALPIQFYDGEGRALNAQEALIRRISQDVEKAEVNCTVVKLRTVRIVPRLLAETEEEEKFLDSATYALNPDTVQIYGDNNTTASIDEISTIGVSARRFVDNQKVKVKLSIPYNVKVYGDISEVEITMNKTMKPEKK